MCDFLVISLSVPCNVVINYYHEKFALVIFERNKEY